MPKKTITKELGKTIVQFIKDIKKVDDLKSSAQSSQLIKRVNDIGKELHTFTGGGFKLQSGESLLSITSVPVQTTATGDNGYLSRSGIAFNARGAATTGSTGGGGGSAQYFSTMAITDNGVYLNNPKIFSDKLGGITSVAGSFLLQSHDPLNTVAGNQSRMIIASGSISALSGSNTQVFCLDMNNLTTPQVYVSGYARYARVNILIMAPVWTVTHNLETVDIVVQPWKVDGPSTITSYLNLFTCTITNSNTVSIATGVGAVSGYAMVIARSNQI